MNDRGGQGGEGQGEGGCSGEVPEEMSHICAVVNARRAVYQRRLIYGFIKHGCTATNILSPSTINRHGRRRKGGRGLRPYDGPVGDENCFEPREFHSADRQTRSYHPGVSSVGQSADDEAGIECIVCVMLV